MKKIKAVAGFFVAACGVVLSVAGISGLLDFADAAVYHSLPALYSAGSLTGFLLMVCSGVAMSLYGLKVVGEYCDGKKK